MKLGARLLRLCGMAVLAMSGISIPPLALAADKPNILVIFGDDIGITNISRYSLGMMGYQTPSIDRLAQEGTIFTDYYGEQSCTAGRAAFITGQHPVRTGLTKVGVPGAPVGIQKQDPTLAELLKPLGYATGQFGKNHLGDRDEFLPTNHGFDEFFGNLYHLNAEEGPEDPDWTRDPAIDKLIRPRGVIHSRADGKIEDLGALNSKRMETIDEEFLQASMNFIDKSAKADKPFFVWFNSSRMHYYTHISDKAAGKSGQGFYNDGMVEHDGHVGQLLKQLDDLGIADNTIVLYTTDNGVHFNQWPDAGITPFRGEKNTNWEGGFRVPAIVRWPGHFQAQRISNEIMSSQDWLPTLMAAAGVPDVKERLLAGYQVGGQQLKVHLDGYNFLPYLQGQAQKGPRNDFYYFSDDGQLLGMRDGDWKVVFAEQRAKRFDVWRDPFVQLRVPKVFNLRRDPFERADTDSNSYNVWWDKKVAVVALPAMIRVQQFLATFKEFPPRQRPASFTVDQMMEKFMHFQAR
ncbi:Arylsulfatase [compost metagenome]